MNIHTVTELAYFIRSQKKKVLARHAYNVNLGAEAGWLEGQDQPERHSKR